MKTFVIMFILVLLFVIGSASAMRYFGNRGIPPSSQPRKPQDDEQAR